MVPKIEMFVERFSSVKFLLRTSISHSTSKKFSNLVVNETEFKTKKIILSSTPYFIKVESTPNCFLKCPKCYHGKGELKNKDNEKMILTLDNFKKIIDPFADNIFGVNLSHRGEPLLNPYLFQIIAYCHERNIGTIFPTSFSMKLSQEQLEQIVTCGLDHLIVSIDGITQDVYEKYRRGGDLNLVLKNASTLINIKNKLNSKTPFVEFKFILFDHNSHQLKDAEKLSIRMGFDKFTVVLDNSSPDLAKIQNQIKTKKSAKKKPCYWPWNSMVIYWDGTVSPCCGGHYKMGNAFETPINSIWNNERYQELRSSFTEQKSDEWQICWQDCWPH